MSSAKWSTICLGLEVYECIVMTMFTETEMLSFWWNFNHWLHRKLSFWQLSVQPVMKISSKWRHFCLCYRETVTKTLIFETNTNTLRHTQNGRHFAEDLNAFPWIKMCEFRLRILNSFSTITHHCFKTMCYHWFTWSLGTEQATRNYLNQWLSSDWCIYGPQGRN